jgi:hypothetical protein
MSMLALQAHIVDILKCVAGDLESERTPSEQMPASRRARLRDKVSAETRCPPANPEQRHTWPDVATILMGASVPDELGEHQPVHRTQAALRPNGPFLSARPSDFSDT